MYRFKCYECDFCANIFVYIYIYICDISDLSLFPINRVSKMCNSFRSSNSETFLRYNFEKLIKSYVSILFNILRATAKCVSRDKSQRNSRKYPVIS